MKKVYLKPEMTSVCLQSIQMLTESPGLHDEFSGNPSYSRGHFNVWDDNWDEGWEEGWDITWKVE